MPEKATFSWISLCRCIGVSIASEMTFCIDIKTKHSTKMSTMAFGLLQVVKENHQRSRWSVYVSIQGIPTHMIEIICLCDSIRFGIYKFFAVSVVCRLSASKCLPINRSSRCRNYSTYILWCM